MAVKIKLKFDLKEIDKFSAIPLDARKKAFDLVAFEYEAMIRDGIDDAKSPDGRPFKPYSEEYAALKKRAGRTVVIDKPDLLLTDAMLKSMTATVTPDGSHMEVSFPGTHQATRFKSAKGPAKGNKRSAPGQRLTVSRKAGKQLLNSVIAEFNDRIRPFIGVSPTGLSRLFRLFLRSVKKTIGKGKT